MLEDWVANSGEINFCKSCHDNDVDYEPLSLLLKISFILNRSVTMDPIDKPRGTTREDKRT